MYNEYEIERKSLGRWKKKKNERKRRKPHGKYISRMIVENGKIILCESYIYF